MYLSDILSAFRQSLMGTVLLVVQVAFTFAVLVNIYAMIDSYEQQIGGDSGYVDEDSLIAITMPNYEQLASTEENFGRWRNVIEQDLNLIRSTPGVKEVVLAHAGIPFQNRIGFNTFDRAKRPDQLDNASTPATRYAADAGTLELLG